MNSVGSCLWLDDKGAIVLFRSKVSSWNAGDGCFHENTFIAVGLYEEVILYEVIAGYIDNVGAGDKEG